jgi:hypothetical protein
MRRRRSILRAGSSLAPLQAVVETMPRSRANHRALPRKLAVLALLCLGALLLAGEGRADSPYHYFNDRTFQIPFDMDPSRPVRQVLLYVSTDGKSPEQVAAAAPRENRFVYTAKADGWYHFVVQVETTDGRFSPANVKLAAPSLRICVDTVKPIARLRQVAPEEGYALAVEWEVSDENLDLSTLKLQYSTANSNRWVPLKIRQLGHAKFNWSPSTPGPFDVRVQVNDKAGNIGTATTRVVPGANVPAGTVFGGSTGNVRIIHVRNRTFKLNYTIGNVGLSNVKHVEVWMTRDTNSWYNFKKDAPAKGPCELNVLQPGRYGFTLRPISGVGRGPRPPGLGQMPQLWVIVDEKAPVVDIHSVVVGEGADNGYITVNWRATDEYLRAQPITIKYSPTGTEGSWKDLQTNLENIGSCRCSVKDIAATHYEFYIRVEAIDEAGNVGSAQTKDTVKIDLNVPTVEKIDAEPTGADGTRPPG